MRKIIVTAAIAVCMAVPGVASANYFVSAPVEMEGQSIDHELLESLLKAAEAQSSYSYGCLCDMYAAGTVEIDKNQNGNYVVTIQEDGGGLAEIILDDSF